MSDYPFTEAFNAAALDRHALTQAESAAKKVEQREADARHFWERCALVGMESMPPDSAASDADLMLAAWRERFAPKEKA